VKRLLWLAVVFISASWLFFIPVFTIPDYNLGLIFLIIGLICSTFAFWKHDFYKIDKKCYVILIPLLFSLLILPFPYNFGPIVLTITILLYFIKNYLLKKEKANWIFMGISFGGIVLTIQTLFYPLYAIFVSHGHRVDILSPIVSSVGGLFGLKTSLNNGIVFVQTLEKIYPFTTTWEKLGFFTWFNIFIGALILFFLLRKSRKIGIHILGFFIFSGVYLILRYILLIYIFTQSENITLLWDPIFFSLSFIPFGLLLMRFAPLKDLDIDLECLQSFSINKKRVAAMFLVFLFMFSLVGTFVFQDPGTEKDGNVLIDELHSDWEDTTTVFDKEWYGMLSTYNYYSWSDWLDKYYTVDKNVNETLTSNLLKDYDILILKCPTNLYSEKEVNDIIEFVNNGGGLYLIGDHTNVFGMNFYLNQISENLGIVFRTDANYELGTGMTSSYVPDKIFPHPVIKNMEKFEFLTSCTLSAPITSENVIIGNRVIGEPGTYSTENFFRESRNSADMEFGLLLQVAAVKHGKGRVLAFTDSTCFSNFCIFMDGYQSFNLGTMEYLNRINTYAYLNTVFIGIAIISLVITGYLLRKEKKSMIIFVFLTFGLLSFSIATPVFSYVNDVNYPIPVARTDFTKVCFDEEHSDFIIDHSPSFEYYGSHKRFGTFFVWTQRLDCIPSLEKTLDNAINKGDVIVIINPTGSFEDDDIDLITDYITQGGNVLVMDSILNTNSTANDLLQNYGVWLSIEYSAQRVYKTNDTVNELNVSNNLANNQSIGNITSPYLVINGGDNLFLNEKNETSIAVVEIGNGKIVVLVDSFTFSNEVMGGTFTEPDESLRSLYNTEYYLFEEFLLKE
jgi:hypothetical protein